MDQSLARWLMVDDPLGWGTTAESRRRQAPDPRAVALDGRGDADQIRFVQELAKVLRWPDPADAGRSASALAEGAPLHWDPFCCHSELTPEAMAAFSLADPGSGAFSEAQLRWLGRPHFALLLVFIRLLRHQRELLNALPARHLHHYYQDRLGFTPLPGEPDRVTVAFSLVEDALPQVLAAGTVLRAGVDGLGRERFYRTLTDLSVNHARVRRLRAIQLERGLISLDTLQVEEAVPSQRFERMLRLVYGDDGPSVEGLRALLPTLRFCSIDGKAEHLQLELHEFVRLMRLVRQRTDAGADQEWAAINHWLGLDPLFQSGVLTDPRDFSRNVAASLLGPNGGALDWKADGLSEVNSIDDLHVCRDEEAVQTFLRRLFTAPSCRLLHDLPPEGRGNQDALFSARLQTFVRLMTMKLHIDGQWQQVNWLLERCGKRRRQLPSWQLDPGTPNSCSTRFAENLALALGSKDANGIPWPVAPKGEPSPDVPAIIPVPCWCYFTHLEVLERRYALPLEDLLRLCVLAEQVLKGQTRGDAWTPIQELLRAAHSERWLTARRASLDRCLDGHEDEEAFTRLLRQALPATKRGGAASTAAPGSAEASSMSWQSYLDQLAPWLAPGAAEALERFGALLRAPGTDPRRLSWGQVVALVEGAQRTATGEQPPALSRIDWRQLHGGEQEIVAEAMAAGEALEPCFRRQRAGVGEAPAPKAGPGFGVASRLLGLAEGFRRIEITFRFTAASGTPEALLASLRAPDGELLEADDCAGLPPPSPEQAGWGLNQALLVEVSTAEGWWVLPISRASLREETARQPEPWDLTVALELTPSDPPLAPLAAGDLPRLRLRLRPWREGSGDADPWCSCGGFEELRLVNALLRVEVNGLKGLRLQQEGVSVDPREPFTPFGSSPEVGRCLYISHPELMDGDLEEIRFTGRWKGLPADLKTHYGSYRGWPGLAAAGAVTAESFLTDLSLQVRHRGAEQEIKSLPLFAKKGDTLALGGRLTPLSAPPAVMAAAESVEDLREEARLWCWRLTPTDFGHGIYPTLAARRVQEMVVAISGAAGRQALAMADAMASRQGSLQQRYDQALQAAGATTVNPDDYTVPEPYTPLLEGLEVSYSRSQVLGTAGVAGGQLLRVHLFGEEEPLALPPPSPPGEEEAGGEAPLLLPSHPHPGELWLELDGARPREPVALAFQLEEGSARGPRPTPAVQWDVRQGWEWQPLPVGGDGTDGLLHSGILRFTVPDTLGERLWIRASLRAPVEAYATVLAIQSQAVEAEAVPPLVDAAEEGEDPADATVAGDPGSQQPLAPHSITALEEPQPAIVAIHQPFSSRAGRAAETEAELGIRAAELLRHKGRALAGWDYERLLWEAFASQLHTVVCQPVREGQPVEVVVIPDLRAQVPRSLFAPGAPADQLAAMESHLRQRCPAEAELVVRNATYVHVMARLWVCLREGVDPAYAERELRQSVIRVLSPWCFDPGAEVRLGGEVRVSDLAAAIDALPFVAYLERLRLFLVDPGGKPLRLDGLETSAEEILRAPAADVVLIAAPSHSIEFVSATAPLSSLVGIGAMRIELDFQVA